MDFDGWRHVVRHLGLRLDPRAQAVVAYEGTVDGVGVRLEVSANALGPEGAVALVFRDAEADEGPWLLVPRIALLTEPSATTGDPSFDDAVGIAAGGPSLLVRLGPLERARIRRAVELGAAVGPSGARLAGPALHALRDVPGVLDAVAAFAAALRCLRQPPVAALAARYELDPQAPAVSRAVAAQIEATLPSLRGTDLEAVCAAMSERAPDPRVLITAASERAEVLEAWLRAAPDDPRLVEVALAAWRRGRGEALVGALAGRILRREGPSAAFHQLWTLPRMASRPAAIAAVLDAIGDRPPGECRDLVLNLEPPDLRTCAQLALLLEAEPGATAFNRLVGLFRRFPVPVAPALIRRAIRDRPRHPDRADTVVHELLAFRGDGRREAELLDGVLALPPEAADIVAALSPRRDEHQLRLVAWLGRARGERVEAAVLHWLEIGNPPVRIAAADALAATGSTRSLPVLDELAAGWLVPGDLRAAARAAAAAIRSRPGIGGLSLAESGAGALSPADRATDTPEG